MGLEDIFFFVLLILLLVIGIAAASLKDLLSSVILFGAYSLIISVLWQQLRVSDVALTEAVVGVIITVMFVATISRTRRNED